MKKVKFILLALLFIGAAGSAKAQDVFNIVLQKAEGIVNNPKTTDFDLKVNQFKVTALRYIPTKGIKLNGSVSTDFMDIQAYYLNVFITDYFTALKKTPAADRKKCIMKFVQATRNNPLYQDPDRESTESFVKDPGGYTPFSINVNWEKAVEELEKAKK